MTFHNNFSNIIVRKKSTFLSQRPVSVTSKLAESNWKPSGFDYLRLFLATSVLIWHTVVMSYGFNFQNQVWAGPYRAFPALILPMFFALSGFLVAGSLDRAGSIIRYLYLRILRIFPALMMEILVTALILGPLITTYSLNRYFADARFFEYFTSLFGDVKTILPGVFESNPLKAVVNGQLWTVPLELKCYAILGMLALFGVYRRPRIFVALVVIVQILFALRAFTKAEQDWSGVPANVLFLCFLAGSSLNLYAHKIRVRYDLALVCAGLSVGLIYIPGGGYFIAGPIAYLTIVIGLFNPPKLLPVASGDYSYGIYLYAFPIQQLVAATGSWVGHWYYNALFGLPATVAVAILSWHFLEKRALTLRRFGPKIESWVLSPLALLETWIAGRFVRPSADAIPQAKILD